MANPQNLKPNSERTPSERKELAKKAGKKSGEARRRQATFKKVFESMLYIEDAEGLTNAEKIAMQLIKTAINGDLKAFVIIRDMLGESPITKTEVTNKNTPQIQKVFITPEQQLATARHMKAMLENC